MNAKPQPDDAADPLRALEAVIAAARTANPRIEGIPGTYHLLVPTGFTVKDVKDPDHLPDHVRTAIEFDDAESLIRYAKRFGDARTIILGDYDAGTITARIDFHHMTPGTDTWDYAQPDHDRHRATLRLRPSEEFKRWDEAEGKFMSQAAFAQFLEENAVDVSDPEPAILIEISRDLEGVQGVTFKSSTRLENGDRSFVYETETKTRGDLKVPREFSLDIPLWAGEPRRVIRCALRWRIEGGELKLGYEWRRVEYARQGRFTELAHEVAEATGFPVMFGRKKPWQD